MSLVPVLVLLTTACTPLRRTVPPTELPRRVVLALDGLDYRDLMAARARGRFAAFKEPARLVSTFPSISDIAWHAVFGVYPPAGYQRVFFSTRHNAVLGDALSAIRPIEYEERMDYAFDTKFHHLGAYLISWPVARREVDDDVKYILSTRGRQTAYLYNVGPDALQHTRGNVAQYLDHLDGRLTALQQEYQRRTGKTLEIVLLSDHGHNRAWEAAFIPIVEELAAQGFIASPAIASPNHVAFSVDGVTTGFGVFSHPDSVERVAQLLASVKGVDIVTSRRADSLYVVQRAGVDSLGADRTALAHVLWHRRGNVERYRYAPLRGDPLALASRVARMQRDGAMDAQGFASAEAWTRYTADAEYPIAVVRIVHGHRDATRNPAPILVSLSDGFRVGLGMVSVANRMRPLGGTHGALSATNAVGVAMSNVTALHDDLAMRVRAQLGGFDDLRAPRIEEPSLHVVSADMLRDDRLHRREWTETRVAQDTGAIVVLSLPTASVAWAGANAQVRFEVRLKDQAQGGGTMVANTVVPLDADGRNIAGNQWGWPARQVGLNGLVPGAQYGVRVRLERIRRDAQGMVIDRAQTVLNATMAAARDGILWSY
ncbi:hypothetical protein GEMMAAP_11690 [Gemmatimonas phototrophica]|uniref:Phosphodiesterase n=2 Tax=Gemmatimonas phototrophica TaxID=1379270 RepID=A0A143BKY7_9BACT|nr:hypothetical protein GEMMAAP_11690 [Gemmatimonas phototrophica]